MIMDLVLHATHTGATLPGENGHWKIDEKMTADFKRYINQPNRKNLNDLLPVKLYAHFVWDAENEKLGTWKKFVALSTFYDFCHLSIFRISKAVLVPWVTEKHVAARLHWARELLAWNEYDRLMFVATTIFIDGTIFADKFEEGYLAKKGKFVVDADDPVEHTYAQFPVLAKNQQLYQGMCLFGRSESFFVNDHRTDGKGAINKEILAKFLRKNVAPLARKIRTALGLPPTEPINIVWDHASSHKARETQQLLQELNLRDAQLPARCPELNVIENLWAIYKNSLPAVMRKKNFREALNVAINAVSDDAVRNLVASFIPRLEKMVEQEGRPFKYKGNQKRTKEVLALL